MSSQTFHISGRLINRASRQGVPGLRVEAWDKDLIFNDSLGSAETNTAGAFQIAFGEEHFQEGFLDRQPDLFFKVFRGNALIAITGDTVRWNISAGPNEFVIEVDVPVPEPQPDGRSGPWIVRGHIQLQDGAPLKGVRVKAFDRDLRSEEPLGETWADSSGYYQIAYTAEQFRRAEKGQPDLLIRTYDLYGTELAASAIHFNAPTELAIDLIVEPPPPLSEYEQVLARLAPVLENVEPAELTDDDILFLKGDTGIDQQHLAWLRQSTRLSRETDLPTELFYGLARQQFVLDLEQLLAQQDAVLRAALESALGENIIPANLAETLDALVQRFERLRLAQGLLVPYQVIGQLLDQATGAPLVGTTVRVLDLDAGPEPKDLGYDVTNNNGLFRATYIAPRESPPAPDNDDAGRRLRFHILNAQAEEILQTEVAVQAGHEQPLQIQVPAPSPAGPHSPALSELVNVSALQLPQALLSFLAQRHINTLADIRQAGGLGSLRELPVAADHPAVRALEAHADLNLISPNVPLNAALIEQGYDNVLAIATAPRTDFIRAVNASDANTPAPQRVGNFKAAQIQVVARAQAHVLDNVLTGMAADHAHLNGTPLDSATSARTKLFPDRCGCRDCETAVSPLVYLADLLKYSLNHLKKSGNSITLNDLVSTFHQPFDALTFSCEAAEAQLRQVRLCVEVLRAFLGPRPLADAAREAALAQAEKNYRLTVYSGLLTRMGVSYAELRAQITDPEARQALADRLGLDQSHLDAFLLDPDASPEVLTEQNLEQLFGLIDTTRDPLAAGTISDLQTWRLEHLRQRWEKEDWPAEPAPAQSPLIDPDLLRLEDLKPSLISNPAFTLWQQRQTEVKNQQTQLEAARQDLAGFDSSLTRVLGFPISQFIEVAATRDKGEAISQRLDQLTLTIDEFDYLLRVRQLVEKGQPVLKAEWDNVYAILVQVWKRRQSARWREQEKTQKISLSPDFFQIPAPPPLEFPAPEPTPTDLWRAPETVRQEWQDRLQAHIDQEQAVIQALKEAVGAVEEAALPMLRDALSLAVAAGSSDEKAKWVTENLLIDASSSGCMMTTRVAQAIETLQSLLWSLRLGQLEDNYRAFSLEADHFDEEWKWMGSYASWRAAMFVFLYPENVLHPSLRNWQTPAFEALVRNTRSNRRLTPSGACGEAAQYARYFQDICSLKIEAACQSRTKLFKTEECAKAESGYRCLIYMFGRGRLTNTVYWSAFDHAGPSDYDQTFWRAVEVKGFENIIEIIGAVPYQVTPEQRFIFLFARKQEAGAQKLVFAKFNLETFNAEEEAVTLELSPGTISFSAVTKQIDTENEPPHLAICSNGTVFERKLDSSGSGWEESDFRSLLPAGLRCLSVKGMVAQGKDKFYLISEDHKIETGEEPDDFDPYDLNLHLFKTEKTISSRIGSDVIVPGVSISGGLLTGRGFGTEEYRGAFSWSGTGDLYVVTGFGNSSALASLTYRLYDGRVSKKGLLLGSVIHHQTGWSDRIISTSGAVDNATKRWFISQFLGINSIGSRFSLKREKDNSLTPLVRIPVIPSVTGPFEITSSFSSKSLQIRKGLIKDAFEANKAGMASNLAYLEEAYYFVPVHLALMLQKSGEYAAALDWLRTVYDYTETGNNRKIYYGLVKETMLSEVYKSSQNWLLDPLNPHAIAATRGNTYTRFTLLAIVRCLLDFADAEFTQDTAESNPRARRLYLAALELLDTPELKQNPDEEECEAIIGRLDDIPVPDTRSILSLDGLKRDLREVADPTIRREIVEQIRELLIEEAPWEQRLATAQESLAEILGALPPPPTLATILQEEARFKSALHSSLLNDAVLVSAVQAAGATAARDYEQTVSMITGLSVARLEQGRLELPWLREPMSLPPVSGSGSQPLGSGNGIVLTQRHDLARLDMLAPTHMATLAHVAATQPLVALNVASRLEGRYVPALAFSLGCIPPNAILNTLRLRAELNLYKLRTCRNIAGLKRQLEPYTAAPDATTGLPAIGAAGRLVLPGATTHLRPTLYRYPALVERAKQLVQLAAQIEAVMLSALEKRDVEAYTLLRARQELNLARAGVQLQSLRVTEAKSGVKLAEAQKQRAQIQKDTFHKWIEAGLNQFEKKMQEQYRNAAAAQKEAADWAAVLQAPAAMEGGAKMGAMLGFKVGGPAGAALGAFVGVTGALQVVERHNEATKNAIDATIAAQIASVNAVFERNKEGWQLQEALAQQDLLIGDQQIQLANQHVQVVEQERTIADIQSNNAKDSIEFLSNKFTRADLYDWMSDVLEGVYRFFLQQATAMARLAENQLAFERQEVSPAFIQADYWEASAEGGAMGNTDAKAPDRKGLTGSARLLQDIYQLDQHAFATNQRKLQLTKIISLSSLDPFAFQQFRESGVLVFTTPMELFDWDFPGHYLRLIKRVRTSVIALVPSTEGIHATLSTTGISRAVIGPEIFQNVIIRRDPEFVALTSPIYSSGLFELEPQSDMLLPFEGNGVETTWEFRMPKAANRFDYRTIADILITIEYTALHSFVYSQQVIQSPTLTRLFSSDRPFSFRHQFADQWYDLHNPELTTSPMTVGFKTVRADFPPNLEALKIQHVVLYAIRKQGRSFELPVTHLHFTEQGSAGAVGGRATSNDGIISTRRSNGSNWTSMIGETPIGEWELALPNTEEIKRRFKDEEIEDILLVITYTGRTPTWPA